MAVESVRAARLAADTEVSIEIGSITIPTSSWRCLGVSWNGQASQVDMSVACRGCPRRGWISHSSHRSGTALNECINIEVLEVHPRWFRYP